MSTIRESLSERARLVVAPLVCLRAPASRLLLFFSLLLLLLLRRLELPGRRTHARTLLADFIDSLIIRQVLMMGIHLDLFSLATLSGRYSRPRCVEDFLEITRLVLNNFLGINSRTLPHPISRMYFTSRRTYRTILYTLPSLFFKFKNQSNVVYTVYLIKNN